MFGGGCPVNMVTTGIQPGDTWTCAARVPSTKRFIETNVERKSSEKPRELKFTQTNHTVSPIHTSQSASHNVLYVLIVFRLHEIMHFPLTVHNNRCSTENLFEISFEISSRIAIDFFRITLSWIFTVKYRYVNVILIWFLAFVFYSCIVIFDLNAIRR